MIAAREAQQLSMKETAYEALYKRISHTTLCRPKELETFFYLGVSSGHEKETVTLLEKYLRETPAPKLYTLLKNHYLSKKAYDKAGALYIACYRQTRNPDCLFEGIGYLFQAKKEKEALHLLKSYEDRYLEDTRYAERIITLYLAHNRLREAHDYTLKVMQHKKVLP